ncbi:MAG: choice-of-anchor Q domain-containing protein [Kofleriaceae bacterium]
MYVAPTGADGGVCSKTMPCATLYYALAQTTDTRQDVVMRPGTYPIPRTFDARSIVNGRAIHVHGYGAVLQPQFVVAPDPYWMLAVNAGTLRVSGVVVEHLASSASGPIFSCKNNGELILRDVRATSPVPSLEGESCSISIVSSSLKSTSAPYSVSLRGNQLEVSRSTIVGGLRTIHGNVTLSNNLFTGRGLSFGPGQGIVSFNTIADTTLPSGNARAIECENPLSRPEIFFNVIWSPIGTATSMVANCAPRDNLVGPLQQSGSGNINEDPRFLGPGNYHLAPTSPARDRATTGPAVDWDGESRPQGAGFDLGYDEITQ